MSKRGLHCHAPTTSARRAARSRILFFARVTTAARVSYFTATLCDSASGSTTASCLNRKARRSTEDAAQENPLQQRFIGDTFFTALARDLKPTGTIHLTADTFASPIALVDCVNFYASCEQLMDPRLRHKPVVVLSNNDGCVVARSQQARALGVRMGVPAFQIRDLIEEHGVAVLSSNYALYGDLSARAMATLSTFSPDVEIYSIDEAFVGLSGFPGKDLTEYARRMQRTVYKWVGLPVRAAVGETKVLAKIASYLAKQAPEKTGGVLNLVGSPHRELALARTPVSEVWGVGPASVRKLHAVGIRTALDLKNADDRWVRKHLTVVGLRIVHELRGINCLPLDLVPPRRRCITYSRSFGRTVETLTEVREAVALYTSRAGEKLRRHRLAAGVVTVFLTTNRFDQSARQYSNSATVELAHPTDATSELLERTLRGAEKIYKEGFAFKKAGVMFTELAPADQLTLRLFENDAWQRSREVSAAMDRINRKHGRETVRLGCVELRGRWSTKFERRSPRYTTQWSELPVVN